MIAVSCVQKQVASVDGLRASMRLHHQGASMRLHHQGAFRARYPSAPKGQVQARARITSKTRATRPPKE
eukprot:87482-Pyramimonas_sp.AAC.1